MEVPVFSRWWEIAIFLLGGLLLSPFLLLLYLWEGLRRKQENNNEKN